MIFVVDEDMGPSIATTLKRWRHTVILAVEAVGAGAADALICKYTESMGGVVVTRNKKDYMRLLGRREHPDDRDFTRAGCIVLSLETHELARARLRVFRELLEMECKTITSQPDPRVLIEILPDRFIVFR